MYTLDTVYTEYSIHCKHCVHVTLYRLSTVYTVYSVYTVYTEYIVYNVQRDYTLTDYSNIPSSCSAGRSGGVWAGIGLNTPIIWNEQLAHQMEYISR